MNPERFPRQSDSAVVCCCTRFTMMCYLCPMNDIFITAFKIKPYFELVEAWRIIDVRWLFRLPECPHNNLDLCIETDSIPLSVPSRPFQSVRLPIKIVQGDIHLQGLLEKTQTIIGATVRSERSRAVCRLKEINL